MQKKIVKVEFDPYVLEANTFHEFARWWYEDYRPKVQASTYESYQYTLAKLIDTFGSFKLVDIQPYHVEAFLNAAVEAGLSKSYVTKCRSMMGKILKKAESFGKIPRNPVPLIDAVKYSPFPTEGSCDDFQTSEKDAFTFEEVQTLLDLLPYDKIGLSIRVLLFTGMRMQELLAIEPHHIEADCTQIRVQQAVKMVHGVPIIGPPKSLESYRDIPIPSIGIPYLQELCEMSQARFVVNGKHPEKPYNTTSYRRIYYRYIEECGVRRLSPHCCRHTYVSQLQAAGVPCETIKCLVGHSKIDMTLQYLHVQKKIKSEAVERLNNLFTKKSIPA